MHLVSLLSGRIVASAGTSNPQIRFGEDLMSRVSYVMMNPDGREAMTKAVREAVNGLIGKVCAEGGVDRARHSRLRVRRQSDHAPPVPRHRPDRTRPARRSRSPSPAPLQCWAHEIGIEVNRRRALYMLPCIAGHVGADAAGATLSEGPYRQDEMMLLVDVGTNAEIVLGNRQRIVAASSPTGPAFEGAEISSGQRAAPGAIERVRIDPETLEPKYRVIGVDKWSDEDGFEEAAQATGVTGICGSAIIEVVAEMYLAGIISEDGVIDGALAARTPRIIQNGRTFSYLLQDGEPRITVTQNDVRAIQLAKAALYAGIKLLMEKQGVETVDTIRFAGAFGSFIDPKYAMVLGLIPDCDLDEVKAVGNAAGTGALMALLNRDHRREIEQQVSPASRRSRRRWSRISSSSSSTPWRCPTRSIRSRNSRPRCKLPPRKVLAEGEGGDGAPRRRSPRGTRRAPRSRD